MNQPPNAMLPYPQPGDVIDGKYRIERFLGEGGMGAVVQATHLLRKAPVALKFMSPSLAAIPGAVERFLNEGVAASQIDCENVVKVFDVGMLPGGDPYLVMEYLNGEDLAHLLARDGKPGLPSPQRCLVFILQVLQGLQVIHDAGIVHRDMKPSNCFVLQREGEPDFVKLLDFGISRVAQSDGGALTQTNSMMGTPLYMSPEQAKSAHHVDQRSDLYSVAVILYELLSGRPPYMSENGGFVEQIALMLTGDAAPLKASRPDLPDELCARVHKGMNRDPALRYQTAAEMCEALAPWADERALPAIMRIRNRAARRSMASMSNEASPAAPYAAIPGGSQVAAGAGSAVMTDTRMGMAATGSSVRPPSKGVPPLYVIGPAVLVIGLIVVAAVWKTARSTPVNQPSVGVVQLADPSSTAKPSGMASGDAVSASAPTQLQQLPPPVEAPSASQPSPKTPKPSPSVVSTRSTAAEARTAEPTKPAPTPPQSDTKSLHINDIKPHE
jgi:serine/threonine protein kinase